MARIDPRRRPHYCPTDRMAILELKAARGWSQAGTARALLVQPLTIASWLQRIDEEGPNALVQIRRPVNRFPDFLHHVVQRLKTLCPTLGKRKIAQVLARAGLHLGSTTVQRMIRSPNTKLSPDPDCPAASSGRVVTARHPVRPSLRVLQHVPGRERAPMDGPERVKGPTFVRHMYATEVAGPLHWAHGVARTRRGRCRRGVTGGGPARQVGPGLGRLPPVVRSTGATGQARPAGPPAPGPAARRCRSRPAPPQ